MNKILWLLWVCLCLSWPSQAEPIHIVGVELPGLLDRDGGGPYNKLFTAIVQDSQLALILDVKPLARAFHEYNGGQYRGLFPATTSIVEIDTLESLPFNRVQALVFTRPGTPAVASLAELNGLVVGKVRGFTYPKAINEAAVQAVLVKNEEQNIKMLMAHRLDAFFGLVPDVYLSLEKLGGGVQLSVDKSIDYMNIHDSFLLLPSVENERMMIKLNNSIKKLSLNGTIKKILGSALVE